MALEAGTIVTLRVKNKQEYGWFLENEEEEAVLLHNSEIRDGFDPNEPIEVFLYQDHSGRLASTMDRPLITLGEYGWVEVVGEEIKHGVFVNIGISKDALVSEDDLPYKFEVRPIAGDKLYCTLKLDKNGRMFAKPATEEKIWDIAKRANKTDLNKDFTGRVYRTGKAGTWIITDDLHRAFLHPTEREDEPRVGQEVTGRIIAVHDDGSVNVSLLGRRVERQKDDAENVYDYLMSRGGQMPYWDKSLPEEIEKRFGISKGAFKRALGKLMKEGRAYQESGWTYAGTKQKSE
ncbi:S1-like domain-containing RNA-binding protein [Domibacillus sp. PGB-M46]|uniref:CvfB family protein n=1 Tax=Domibacillus sp. PGB-M46 TaxID=2910255 RepID=UPI001F5A037F|nr:S1-like domain-containing RNA-binding protein [Domibacillus sp. PGB-M46]MCI2253050.1 S1-like domain-containing RNA-binding protein [Domibacillus sp. PGB-M46]